MAVRIAKDYGAVATHGSKELKLQKLKDDRLALVSYKDGMSVAIHDITEEAKELKRLLEDYLGYKTPVKEEESDVVKTLTTLPAGDCNYQTALKSATEDDLKKAIEIMQNNGGRNATRIKTCQAQLSKGKVVPIKSKAKTTTTAPKEKEEKKVIIFENPKPEIIPLKTTGKATYEECEEKLDVSGKIFTDFDSQYVIEGLKELCKVDADFRNNVMKKEKTYGGFMEYMYKAAQNGYCIKYENVGWIDRDTGLGLAIDYFNHDEAEEERRRKEEEEKQKAKAAAKGGKANGKKKSTKKRRTRK